MRKLQIRKYTSVEEFSRDVQVASQLILKNRQLIENICDKASVSYDKRRELVIANFPKIISAIETLNDVLPNMSNWINKIHVASDDDMRSKLVRSVALMTEKSAKLKTRFLTTARHMTGQTSKKFRALSNSVKVHVDSELSGLYRASEIDILMMPSKDTAINVAVLSYSDLKDTSGFIYPKFFAYLSDADKGVEVRSSPFESFHHKSGENMETAAQAARYLLSRFKTMNIQSKGAK